MSIRDRAKARRAKLVAERPRVRVTWGADGVIQWPTAPAEPKPKPKPASNIRLFLPKETGAHEPGNACPHCGGSGRYLIHSKRSLEKCFRCDGKGVLDDKDLAFYQRRREHKLPLSTIFGGAAA